MFLSKKALELLKPLDNENPELVKLKEYISKLEICLLDAISSEEDEVNNYNGRSYTSAVAYREVMSLPKNIPGEALVAPFSIDVMRDTFNINPDYIEGSI